MRGLLLRKHGINPSACVDCLRREAQGAVNSHSLRKPSNEVHSFYPQANSQPTGFG